MRNRLVELLKNAHDEQKYLTSDKSIQAIADDLLANGVVVIPCKVGDIVYETDGIRIYESTILDIFLYKNKPYYETDGIDFDESAIGKSVFLTKEDAERALKGEKE